MAPVAESVIHDLGYQRYAGARLGRGYAVRSLYVHSLRSAFGLGRGAKAKIFPWSIVGLVAAIALIVTAVTSVAGERVMTYPEFSDNVSTLTVLLAAVIASEIVTRDLGAGVLPLYFARPLTRADYAGAKIAATVSAIMLVLGGAQFLMFAGNAFSTKRGLRGVFDEAVDFAGGVGFSAIHALVIGSIGVLAACLCRRKAFAAVSVVAAFLVTTPVTGVLAASGRKTLEELSGLTNPVTTVGGVGNWFFDRHSEVGPFGPVYALLAAALVALAVFATITRYRKVKS